MTPQCGRHIVGFYPDTVVDNFNGIEAAAFDVDDDSSSAGINCVLNDLFNDGRWTLDYFSRSYLTNRNRIELANVRHRAL